MKAGRSSIGNSYLELAVISALRTMYFMAQKNLPNDHFADLKHFLVVQGSTDIGNILVLSLGVEDDS